MCRAFCLCAGVVVGVVLHGVYSLLQMVFFFPVGQCVSFFYHRRTRETAFVQDGRGARPALAWCLAMLARCGAASNLARDNATRATGRAGPQIGLSCHREGRRGSLRGKGLSLLLASGSFGRHRGYSEYVLMNMHSFCDRSVSSLGDNHHAANPTNQGCKGARGCVESAKYECWQPRPPRGHPVAAARQPRACLFGGEGGRNAAKQCPRASGPAAVAAS